MRVFPILLAAAASLSLLGCQSGEEDQPGTSDADADTDNDSDTDADTDTDRGTDTDLRLNLVPQRNTSGGPSDDCNQCTGNVTLMAVPL